MDSSFIPTLDDVVTRLRAESGEHLAPSGNLWGDVRGLCHHAFTGVEELDPWLMMLEGLEAGERDKVVDYIAHHWGCRRTLWHCLEELRFRQVLALGLACKRVGPESFGAPVVPTRVDDWERDHGVALGSGLRRVLLELGSGLGTHFEHSFFDFDGPDSAFESYAETLLFVEEVERDEPRDVGLIELNARALACLESHPMSSVSADVLDQAAPGHLRARLGEAITIESYADGNHGDRHVAVFGAGPWENRCLIWRNTFRRDATSTFEVLGFSTWLKDALIVGFDR